MSGLGFGAIIIPVEPRLAGLTMPGGPIVSELLRADDVSRICDGVPVLDGVSLAVTEGECFGVFGLSGSGKSALLRILAGEEQPDKGSVALSAGCISFAHQMPFLNGLFTVQEALLLYAALYGIPRGKRRSSIREVLTMVGFDCSDVRRIGALSSGERKLLEIARALLSPAEIILLDEPMADLDFDMRRRVWESLLKLRAYELKTIVIATSRPDDAEICDRIAMLHRGRVLAVGAPSEIRGIVGQEAMVIRPISPKASQGAQSSWHGVVEFEQDDSITIEMSPDAQPVELLRRIPGNASAIRVKTRGLDSILEELAARIKV